jgi:hypothetical protein
MRQKLFIGGLSFSTPTERLRQVFEQIEGVAKLNGTQLARNAAGNSRGRW